MQYLNYSKVTTGRCVRNGTQPGDNFSVGPMSALGQKRTSATTVFAPDEAALGARIRELMGDNPNESLDELLAVVSQFALREIKKGRLLPPFLRHSGSYRQAGRTATISYVFGSITMISPRTRINLYPRQAGYTTTTSDGNVYRVTLVLGTRVPTEIEKLTFSTDLNSVLLLLITVVILVRCSEERLAAPREPAAPCPVVPPWPPPCCDCVVLGAP